MKKRELREIIREELLKEEYIMQLFNTTEKEFVHSMVSNLSTLLKISKKVSESSFKKYAKKVFESNDEAAVKKYYSDVNDNIKIIMKLEAELNKINNS